MVLVAWENRAASGPRDSLFVVGGVICLVAGAGSIVGILGTLWARREGAPGPFIVISHFTGLATVWFLSAFAAAVFLHWDEHGAPTREIVPSGTAGAVQFRDGVAALTILLVVCEVSRAAAAWERGARRRLRESKRR